MTKIQQKLSKKEIKTRDSKRIRKYARFLKTNYEWDYIHIIDLLRFKIKNVRECITENGLTEQEDLNKMTSNMLETERLLERVISHNYHEDLKKEFIKKFGGNIELKEEKNENQGYSLVRDYSQIAPEKLEEAKEEYSKNFAKENELRKNDLKKAFEIMTEHIWDWWD